MSSGSYIGKTYMIKKGKCTVCKKVFTVKKGESLIGKLGIIPVDLCKTHLKKVLSYDEMNLNDCRHTA